MLSLSSSNVQNTVSTSNNKTWVLIDDSDPTNESLVLNLDSYSEAIVKIVIDSEPNFTIGIYGEWGTGKTTLMKLIREKLENEYGDNIVSVWFNAWRYEREENYGLVALLKTIAIELDKRGHYKSLSKIIKRSLLFLGKDFLRQFAAQFITGKGIEEFEKNILPRLEKYDNIDKNTIYFDGLNKISQELKEIRLKDNSNRIIVFIDDLDRCSPKKVLELFESIKVFLNMEGFIYIVGLSHETISKLISAEYKVHDIKGEDYIKK